MNNWYYKLKKSKYSPPNYIFGIVWPILYLSMVISFIIIIINNKCNNYRPIIFFFVQLLFNLSWSFIFFKLKSPRLALIDLILIIIFTIITISEFYKISMIAASLLIPYIIWLLFAFFLNIYIVIYN
uniref:TspO/MBR family protein n=1 Tax=viral metagenome TaxID=1070528 RepID=A0A6C0CWE3_9ZZZZ